MIKTNNKRFILLYPCLCCNNNREHWRVWQLMEMGLWLRLRLFKGP